MTPITSFLETEPLWGIAEVRRNKTMLPSLRGAYGLFFRTPPGSCPINGCYVREGLCLLYIGTAGADLGKNGTLRRRLGDNHLGGNERRSTFCQTLAALLPDVADHAIAKNERGNIKFHTSPDGATRLRNWIDENVSVCWITVPRPADFEVKLIG